MNCYNNCKACRADKENCDNCRDNPKYMDYHETTFFVPYNPVCPIGIQNCVVDPAYIECYYPEWYKKLYGDITPEEAVKISCQPDGTECDDYDDEDK